MRISQYICLIREWIRNINRKQGILAWIFQSKHKLHRRRFSSNCTGYLEGVYAWPVINSIDRIELVVACSWVKDTLTRTVIDRAEVKPITCDDLAREVDGTNIWRLYVKGCKVELRRWELARVVIDLRVRLRRRCDELWVQARILKHDVRLDIW